MLYYLINGTAQDGLKRLISLQHLSLQTNASCLHICLHFLSSASFRIQSIGRQQSLHKTNCNGAQWHWLPKNTRYNPTAVECTDQTEYTIPSVNPLLSKALLFRNSNFFTKFLSCFFQYLSSLLVQIIKNTINYKDTLKQNACHNTDVKTIYIKSLEYLNRNETS